MELLIIISFFFFGCAVGAIAAVGTVYVRHYLQLRPQLFSRMAIWATLAFVPVMLLALFAEGGPSSLTESLSWVGTFPLDAWISFAFWLLVYLIGFSCSVAVVLKFFED